MRFLVSLLTLLATGWAVAGPTQTLLEQFGTAVYGNGAVLTAHVLYDGPPCPATARLPPMTGSLTLRMEGEVIQSGIPFFLSFYRGCENGHYSAGKDISVPRVEFGRFTFSVEYTGDGELQPSRSAPLAVQVQPDATGAPPDLVGTINVGLATPSFNNAGGWYCPSQRVDFTREPGTAAPPGGVAYPYGFIKVRLQDCFLECGFLCPAGPPERVQQTTLIEFPGVIPPGSRLWAYTPTADQPSPGWQPLDATFSGTRATTLLTGGLAFGVPLDMSDGTLNATVALAVDPALAAERNVEDMWWSGPQENGWGAVMAQRGEKLFVPLYVYDGAGKPTWFVLPSGSWDPAHSVYSGELYHPTGSSFSNYDASRFSAGPPVGSLQISFASDGAGTLDYQISGTQGRKAIQRLSFAARPSLVPGRYGGLWWGGPAQNGWGATITQQGDTLFVVWFTYDAGGNPVWYVMPGGAWTSDGYSGTLFRTAATPWAGASYDATRLVATPVGTLTLAFSSGDAGTMSYLVNGVTGVLAITRQLF